MKGNDYFVQICRSPLTFGMLFIHPGRLFILRRVNAAAVYHTSGTGKGLFRVKLVKVHTASMPCALVVGFCVFFIVDSFNVSAILSIEIAEVF